MRYWWTVVVAAAFALSGCQECDLAQLAPGGHSCPVAEGPDQMNVALGATYQTPIPVPQGTRLRSSDESVLTVTSSSNGAIELAGLREGTATVQGLDASGNESDQLIVTVMRPTGIVMQPTGTLQAMEPSVTVVAGASMPFCAALTAGEKDLNGVVPLTAIASGVVSVSTGPSGQCGQAGFPVVLHAVARGQGTVDLSLSDVHETLSIKVIAPSEITSIKVDTSELDLGTRQNDDGSVSVDNGLFEILVRYGAGGNEDLVLGAIPDCTATPAGLKVMPQPASTGGDVLYSVKSSVLQGSFEITCSVDGGRLSQTIPVTLSPNQ